MAAGGIDFPGDLPADPIRPVASAHLSHELVAEDTGKSHVAFDDFQVGTADAGC